MCKIIVANSATFARIRREGRRNETEDGMSEQKEYHIIFQSANGKDGAWLDYCREEPNMSMASMQVWAAKACETLKTKFGYDFRFRIEHW